MGELAGYLEIEDVLDKFPAQMSGGQRQRVAAARALILNPEIILADEPTGALDSRNAKTLMEKLSGLNREQDSTILMVTHDSNAASYCTRILFILAVSASSLWKRVGVGVARPAEAQKHIMITASRYTCFMVQNYEKKRNPL
jgi:ABC-type lipoprotein export system ATPase subunit